MNLTMAARYVGVILLMVGSARIWEIHTSLAGWMALLSGLVSFLKSEADLHGLDDRQTSDRALLKKLFEDLPPDGAMEYLGDHDMRAMIERAPLNEVDNFRRKWGSVQHEFHDGQVERLRLRLLELMADFDKSLSEHIDAVHSPDHVRVPTKWRDEEPAKYMAAADELQNLVGEMFKTYEELVRTARRNLRI